MFDSAVVAATTFILRSLEFSDLRREIHKNHLGKFIQALLVSSETYPNRVSTRSSFTNIFNFFCWSDPLTNNSSQRQVFVSLASFIPHISMNAKPLRKTLQQTFLGLLEHQDEECLTVSQHYHLPNKNHTNIMHIIANSIVSVIIAWEWRDLEDSHDAADWTSARGVRHGVQRTWRRRSSRTIRCVTIGHCVYASRSHWLPHRPYEDRCWVQDAWHWDLRATRARCSARDWTDVRQQVHIWSGTAAQTCLQFDVARVLHWRQCAGMINRVIVDYDHIRLTSM